MANKKISPELEQERGQGEAQSTEESIIEKLNEASFYASLPEEDRERIINDLQEQFERIEKTEKMERGPTLSEREMAERGANVIRLKEEVKELESRTQAGRIPDLYYARQTRRSAEAEELRKLQTDNADELISFFGDALAERDRIRCSAIFRKLCGDANENEILNYYGYDSTAEGMKDFGEGVLVRQLGMTEQEMLALMSDCSYLNEERGHWETARIVGVRDGVYRWLERDEHVTAALAEIRKMQPREVARRFNRLAYGGETPREKFHPEEGRDFKIGLLGIGILLAMGDAMAGFIVTPEEAKKGGKGEMPANTIGNLYSQLAEIRAAGVSREFCDRIQKAVEGGLIMENLGDIVRQAREGWEKVQKKS